jgi:protein SCO1/2
LLLVLAADRARADDTNLPPTLRQVGFDQRLDEQVPPELVFRDETGSTVKLGDYFGRKPIILVLAYYRCPQLCGEVLNGLGQTLLELPFDVGNDFDILTVSFDPREKPDLAAAKKRHYIERYGRPGAAAGWHWLTGEEDQIERLTKAVGFRYTYDARHDQYAHASGIMVLTPEGKLSRYFYGIRYSPRDVKFGLMDASDRKIGSRVDQILLYCFHYDPNDGKYGATVMTFVRLAGVLTVLGLGTFIGLMVRAERRRARAAASGGAPLVPLAPASGERG